MTREEFKATREEIRSILPDAEFIETFGGFGFVLGVKIQSGRTVARASLSTMPTDIQSFCDAMSRQLRGQVTTKKRNAESDRLSDI